MVGSSFREKLQTGFTYALTVFLFLIFLAVATGFFQGTFAVVVAVVCLAVAVGMSVHHADVIAHKVGPSLGGLILAVAVTIIEVGLILSMMSNDTPESVTVARDTVFSAIIIVTNGILGICFIAGGLRHRELKFQIEGTSSLMAVLATLVGLTLVLPNFTTSTPGPFYSNFQLMFAGGASFLLYVALLISQTITHKSNFDSLEEDGEVSEVTYAIPSRADSIMSSIGLLICLIVVIGLAKTLAPSIEAGVIAIGAPKNVVGIVIALLVLLPEAGAALAAARANHLQSTLNLALGSAVASIALTIPVISLYSILADRHVALGLGPKEIAFTMITFIVAGFTLGTGRVSALKGVVHVMLLLAYLALSFEP